MLRVCQKRAYKAMRGFEIADKVRRSRMAFERLLEPF
jgi:hypothetical protein